MSEVQNHSENQERAISTDKFEFLPSILTPEQTREVADEARVLRDSRPDKVLPMRFEGSDTDKFKADYSVLRLSSRLVNEAELAALQEVAPRIYDTVVLLRQRLMLRPVSAVINYYEPHTWIPRHADRSTDSPQTFVAVGLEGEGEFTVYDYDEATFEEQNTTFPLLPGDATVLKPIQKSRLKPAITVGHSAANLSDSERITLNLSFIPEIVSPNPSA